MCVLALLSKKDSYAYDIANRMSVVGMSEGTVYPLMHRMQTDGLVDTYMGASEGGPARRYYKITKVGRTAFNNQRADWKNFKTAVDAILGDET